MGSEVQSMKKLSYDERDYAARLAEYIADETYTQALYMALSKRCTGNMASLLRSISADEGRHLREMQMEYYLLTGDSLCPPKRDTDGAVCELLRMAYAGEGKAAEGYADEAEMHSDGALRKKFSAISADETRHRAMIRKMLSSALGMG